MLAIFWTLFRSRTFAARHFGSVLNASRLTLVVIALLVVHLTEAVCWAASYFYKGCFADFNTSLYFSMITYTTLGYGDVVLRDKEWRLLAGLEALTGSLMVCWSTVILVQASPQSIDSVERFGKRKSCWRVSVFTIPTAGDDVFPSSVWRRVGVIGLPQCLVASGWWAQKRNLRTPPLNLPYENTQIVEAPRPESDYV